MTKSILLVFLVMISSFASAQKPNTLTRREKREGWKLLFDGISTKGWHTFKRDTVGSKWQVRDQVLVFDTSKPRNGGGDIVTNEEYENYELRLEWKISKGGNSGIMIDVQEAPQYQATYVTGPEMQVLDNISADDNKIPSHLAGCLYDLAGDASVSKPNPPGEWNQVRIIQNRGHLTFWLNGVQTYDGQIGSDEWKAMVAKSKFRNQQYYADFAKVARGRICLQQHPGSSEWRNIKIKVLP